MKKSIVLWFFLLASIFQAVVVAQSVTVTARIDSAMMWIGQQTRLSFEVSQLPNQKVQMPIFSDTIVGGLEMVEPVKVDTVKSADGHLLITQSYLVTAFEDSLLYIPPFPFVVDDDTIWSKSLSLKIVQPFEIDTISNQIADIKPVYTPSFYWKGILKVVLIVLGIFILVLILFFILRKYIQKKPVFATETKEPALPPYVLAISKLDKIKSEKLWQKNKSKEYHTEITDVLREFIEKQMDIPAMEMTSEEILEHLHHLNFEQKSAYQSLKQVLKLADLVKFAKWEPMIDEHELSLMNSYLFVNQTKIEQEEVPVDESGDVDAEKNNA